MNESVELQAAITRSAFETASWSLGGGFVRVRILVWVGEDRGDFEVVARDGFGDVGPNAG